MLLFPFKNPIIPDTLYFGTNTTWYLQFQLVCDKLFTSFILNVLLSIYFFAIVSRKTIIY